MFDESLSGQLENAICEELVRKGYVGLVSAGVAIDLTPFVKRLLSVILAEVETLKDELKDLEENYDDLEQMYEDAG